MFPIEDLRQAVETAKRFLTKEKIERQLSGQSSGTTPFMKVSDGHTCVSNKKSVSFNTLETLERTNENKDKFTSLVDKMRVNLDKHDAQFKPQI